ncbi:MAG: fibrobacter succinogenes major paralogous domain-containing protein [Daejeonella sp.]
MKTIIINSQAFKERWSTIQSVKVLGLLLVSFTFLFTSCKKDKKAEKEPEEIKKKPTIILGNLAPSVEYNGFTYKAVKIGDQTWMVDNLRTTKYQDGSDIFHAETDQQWKNAENGVVPLGVYSAYEQKNSNINAYGLLYNYYAATALNELSPPGWHIPTKKDWNDLQTFLKSKGDAGLLMKEAGTAHWKTSNAPGNNDSGFTGLPGGVWIDTFGQIKSEGMWWSSTSVNSDEAYSYYLSYNTKDLQELKHNNKNGFSIRCIKD